MKIDLSDSVSEDSYEHLEEEEDENLLVVESYKNGSINCPNPINFYSSEYQQNSQVILLHQPKRKMRQKHYKNIIIFIHPFYLM